MGTLEKTVDCMPTVADVERNPLDGSQVHVPWEAPMDGMRVNGAGFVLGGLNDRASSSGKGLCCTATHKNHTVIHQRQRELVGVPYLRGTGGIARVSVPTARVSAGVAPSPHTEGPRRVWTVGSCNSI